MRHTTAAAAAVLLLALTACSTESDNPPATASPKPGQTAATEQTEQPTDSQSPADEATAKALEQAVRAYSDAYFAADTKKAHGMMTNRCQATAPIEVYGPVVEAAVKQYGQQEIKTFAVDQLSGDLARVTYTYSVPMLDQKQQPWAREGGAWRFDGC
ncbi:hypothetical protein ABZ070_10245 [Streptomyces sp. NPDC006283]|uniref:hypothetical protein n=1 Tax=Streptomyces sp. NPDC006283 TaxID=3156741 RepID=UPI0033B7062B